jgi:hypothetical protein
MADTVPVGTCVRFSEEGPVQLLKLTEHTSLPRHDLGPCYYRQRETDVDFLQRRFPGHCPHHLLHNLLNLHYSRHELCSAAPFTNDECRLPLPLKGPSSFCRSVFRVAPATTKAPPWWMAAPNASFSTRGT